MIYRPPNSNMSYYEHISDLLDNALNESMPVFPTGDFNIDMLTKGNNTFKQLMVKNNLKNLVDEATNFTSTPGTCIDLIFTNNASLVDKVYVASPFCSTHSPISFDIKYKTLKQYAFKRTVRNYHDVDFQIINNDMNNVSWNSCL